MRLRESGEDYLEAILVLQQKHGAVRAIDIAGYLDVTKRACLRRFQLWRARGSLKS